MGRRVDVDDLLDAHEVAKLLGFASAQALSVNIQRGKKIPEPVYDRGQRKAKLWLRQDIEKYLKDQVKK
jgi:hypothetical protein